MSHVAIVTGATGGIGRVIVERLLAAEYRVIACGRDRSRMEALLLTVPLGWCTPCYVDLAEYSSSVLANALDGCLWDYDYDVDLLVCAHGAAPCTTPTLAMDDDAFERIWRTDVSGTFHIAKAVGHHMVARKQGSIVFISSAHARATYPHRTPYATSKAAVCAMARALAVEWGQYGITVNTIVPWQVSGPRSDAIAAQELAQSGIDTLELYRQRSPMRRLVRTEDIADAVLFLAQNTSITGQELVLDCGVSASMWHRGYTDEPH